MKNINNVSLRQKFFNAFYPSLNIVFNTIEWVSLGMLCFSTSEIHSGSIT